MLLIVLNPDAGERFTERGLHAVDLGQARLGKVISARCRLLAAGEMGARGTGRSVRRWIPR
jgi:hypothetical protein